MYKNNQGHKGKQSDVSCVKAFLVCEQFCHPIKNAGKSI